MKNKVAGVSARATPSSSTNVTSTKGKLTNATNNSCEKMSERTNRNENKLGLVQALFGSLNGEIQSTARAELEAITHILHRTFLPIEIVNDHANHVEAVCKGKSSVVTQWAQWWTY